MTDRFVFHPERLDEVVADHWAADELSRILEDPEFAFSYDDEGSNADLLIQVLTGSNLLDSPHGVTLWFDWSMGPDHTPYYAFYITIQKHDLGPRLRLYGYTEDYPDFGYEGIKGRDAVLALWTEAVATGNDLLNSLAAYCHEEVR